jgi:hypothetical protein
LSSGKKKPLNLSGFRWISWYTVDHSTTSTMQEGSVDDADRREMVEQIAARLKGEYDLKG